MKIRTLKWVKGTKAICMLLICCLVFAFVPIQANALTSPDLTIAHPSKASPGEYIDVVVGLANNPGIAGMSIHLGFDPAALEAVDITIATGTPIPQSGFLNPDANPVVVMFSVPITPMIGFVNSYDSGELMTIRFRVLSATGAAPLSITSSASSAPPGGGFVLAPVAVNHPAQSQFTVTPPAATVTSVTVDPATATVQQGNSQDFTATVVGTNNPAQTVTWTVEGGVAGTTISSDGVLTVAADVTATTLTVRATSTLDNTVSGLATVTVTLAPPTVTSVTVNPQTANVQQGNTQDFAATVVGTNNPAQTVMWTVEGGVASTIISLDGMLTVATDETATTLTVRATSTVDSTMSGTATVTVTLTPPTVTSVTVNPQTANVQQGNTQDFTATVAGTNNPEQTVTWTVEGGVAGTTISSDGVLTVAADETATTLTVKAISTVDSTMSGTATVTVTLAPPTVTSVTIDPATATVQQGSTQDFVATVVGTNNPEQTVTWAAEGGVAGTTISSGGVLTVAADETATTLTVRATSTFDNTVSGTATVTVIPPVESIAVTTQPTTLSYTAGQTLNLAGLVVTITFTDGTTQVVPFADFAANGLTANPASGIALTVANHNGNPITITHTASGQTATTNNLAVAAAGGNVGGGGAAPPVVNDEEEIEEEEVPLAPSYDYRFRDVNSDHWFYNAVNYVYGNNIMRGVSDDLFAPNASFNRAMAATVLFRMAGAEANFAQVFDDVVAGQWYSEAITWAAANGIVLGIGNNLFDSYANVTREQLAAMFFRYATFMGFDLSTSELTGFFDIDDVGYWALEAMSWAVHQEIIQGVTGNRLNPRGTATRAECATIIMRMMERFN